MDDSGRWREYTLTEQQGHVQLGRLSRQRPLVGRDQEYAHLRNLLLATELCQHKEHVAERSWPLFSRVPGVFLQGEAGIGKTRLAEELSREAQGRGWSVIWSRCHLQECHIPYYAWSEAARYAWRNGLWPCPEDAPRREYLPLAALVPELVIDPAETVAQFPYASSSLHLWEAMLALLRDICSQAPLLLVLDDLQWADNSSIELTGYLLRRLAEAGVLIVITCRETELSDDHALPPLIDTLHRELLLTRLRVSRLSGEHIRKLLFDLPEPQARSIQQQAAGNPFFAEELARVATRAAASARQQALTLPQTIAGVLDRRLSGLSTSCQSLLNHAAVLGDALSFAALFALMNSGRQMMDEEELVGLLDEALQAAVLTEEREGEHILYYFWHPLLQSRLYERLSAARRARIHQRAADVLCQLYAHCEDEGEGAEAARITDHLLLSGADTRKITHYARLAGDRAYLLSAYPAAERYYTIVLDQQGVRVPDPRRFGSEELEALTVLFERLGECLRNQGKFEEARGFYEQALRLYCERYQPLHFSEIQMQALLWCEIGVTWYDMGNNVQARQCYQYGERVLFDNVVDDGEGKPAVNPALAYLRYQQSYAWAIEGCHDEARQAAEEALSLFQVVYSAQAERSELPAPQYVTRTRHILSGEPINLGRTQSLLGLIACGEGRIKEGLEHLLAALALYEKHGYRREISITCCNIGDAYLRQAGHAQARPFLHRSLEIAEQMGDLPSAAVAAGNLGQLALRTGHLVEAEYWLRRSVSQMEHLRDARYNCFFRSHLAQAVLDQGRLDEARLILSNALLSGRSVRATSVLHTSPALVTLGGLHLVEALSEEYAFPSLALLEKREDLVSGKTLRLLQQARRVLQRALSTMRMEVETRAEARLYLVQIQLHLAEIDEAETLSQALLADLERVHLRWLLPRALRIMACVYLQHEQYTRAHDYFVQSLQLAQQHEQTLEQAHTLYHYGAFLLQGEQGEGTSLDVQRGLSYLRQALNIFIRCQAAREIKLVKALLPETELTERVQTA